MFAKLLGVFYLMTLVYASILLTTESGAKASYPAGARGFFPRTT